VELRIEKAVYRGLGLARHEGLVVLLPRAIPAERVRARVETVERGYARAAVESVLEAAGSRRPSPCPYVPACGGCAYQEIRYEDQLGIKSAILRESLGRAGVTWEGELPVLSCPENAWRARASLHVEAGHGRVVIGLHREGTHRIVDLEACLQLSAAMNRVVAALRGALAELGPRAAAVRGIELAESFDGRQLVATVAADLPTSEAQSLARLGAAAPDLTGFGATLPRTSRRGRLFLGLRGEPFVVSRVGGVALRSHVESFFQANRFLTPGLLETVARMVPAGGPVLDLFAGVGLFALPLASRGDAFRAAEISEAAVEDARVNAEVAGLDPTRIERLDVGAALARWGVEPGERVVLDPPRTGAGPGVVRALVARRPARIVYVSCDPPTLGRDLRELLAAGYRLDALEAFDLFPDTFHLETVASLGLA
jgi:23S rRNA (uracil1939-C5)-methyltransferase